MQTNYLEQINNARKHIDSDPSLVAYIVRDWQITEQAGLSDLAWAMCKENNIASKSDAKYLLDKLEAHLTSNAADAACPHDVTDPVSGLCQRCFNAIPFPPRR